MVYKWTSECDLCVSVSCRYTMVFIFYALSVVLMLLVRPWLAQRFLPKHGKMSIYAALYFFPTLALIQAVFGGLICEYY